MGRTEGFFKGVAEAVERRLVKRASYELQPHGEARGGGPAGHREAWEAVQVRRPGKAGEGRVDGLFVALYRHLALPDLGGRDRDARRQDHVDFPEYTLELPARQ